MEFGPPQGCWADRGGVGVNEEEIAACLLRLEQTDVVDVLRPYRPGGRSHEGLSLEPDHGNREITRRSELADEDKVLLQPIFVDAYASAIIIAAKDDPRGIGHLMEETVLRGEFPMNSDERIPDKEVERKVLIHVIEHRLRAGKKDIVCPNCDERQPLYDLLLHDSEATTEALRRIDEDARQAKDRQVAIFRVEGLRVRDEHDVFLSYNSQDRQEVLRVAENLKAVGLRPWLDVWDLVPGRPWQEALEKAIDKLPCAAI